MSQFYSLYRDLGVDGVRFQHELISEKFMHSAPMVRYGIHSHFTSNNGGFGALLVAMSSELEEAEVQGGMLWDLRLF